MKLTPEHWRKIRELLQGAIELQPRERETYLDKFCGPSLRVPCFISLRRAGEAPFGSRSPCSATGSWISYPTAPICLSGGEGPRSGLACGIRFPEPWRLNYSSLPRESISIGVQQGRVAYGAISPSGELSHF